MKGKVFPRLYVVPAEPSETHSLAEWDRDIKAETRCPAKGFDLISREKCINLQIDTRCSCDEGPLSLRWKAEQLEVQQQKAQWKAERKAKRQRRRTGV